MPGKKSKQSGPEPTLRYRGLIIPAALLLVTIAIRLAARYWGEPELYFNNISDSYLYLDWAQKLISGADPLFADTAYFLGPLYPRLLALLGAKTETIITAQQILGAGVVLIIYFTARRAAGETAGLAAGLLAALYKPFLFYELLVLPETLLLFLITAAVACLSLWTEKRKAPPAAVGGLLLGLAAAAKGTALPLIALVALLITLTGIKANIRSMLTSLAAFLVLAGAAIAPVTWHNISVGSPTLLTTNSGLNFYLGAFGNGEYERPHWLDLNTDFTGRSAAEDIVGHQMSAGQSSTFFRHLGLAKYREDPADSLGRLAHKLWLILNGREAPQAENILYAQKFRPVLRLPLPGWALLLSLAFGGIIYLKNRPLLSAVYLSPAIGAVAIGVIFFVVGRFRIPAAGGLCIAGGIAVAGAANDYLAGAKRGPLMFLLITMLSVALLSLPVGAGPTADIARGYLNHGQYLRQTGSASAAEVHLRRATELDRSNPWAFAGLALLQAGAGRNSEAIELYSRAIELDPGEPTFRLNQALLYYREKMFDAAEQEARNTLAIDPGIKKAQVLLKRIAEENRPAIPMAAP